MAPIYINIIQHMNNKAIVPSVSLICVINNFLMK